MLIVVAGAALVAGCAQATTGTPGGSRLDVTVLELTGGRAGPVAFVADEPVDLSILNSDEAAEPPEDQPGMSYVVVNGSTGCRWPDTVDVTRDGAGLTVAWLGGTDREECAAAFHPIVQFAVRSSLVDGVRRVNDIPVAEPPVAKPTGFVELGPLRAPEIPPVTFADREALYQHLVTADAEHLDDARELLDQEVADGATGYAFVLAGCAETGATMIVTERALNAELTGGENTNCDTAVYFLTTFELADDKRPPGAKLGGEP